VLLLGICRYVLISSEGGGGREEEKPGGSEVEGGRWEREKELTID
jgi:hypothetical protein